MKYQIKQVGSEIFAVVVKNKYDRAMLFCRAQEYYECPNPKFRGKSFSIWDYMKWYGSKYGKGFSYGADWSGFNVPIQEIAACYAKLQNPETPYDKIMVEILSKVGDRGYLIGCENTKNDTFKHEVCHALYHSDPEYKERVDAATRKIPKHHYSLFKKNLLSMGYSAKVVDDEIQAYFQYGYENNEFGKGVPLAKRKQYSEMYKP